MCVTQFWILTTTSARITVRHQLPKISLAFAIPTHFLNRQTNSFNWCKNVWKVAKLPPAAAKDGRHSQLWIICFKLVIHLACWPAAARVICLNLATFCAPRIVANLRFLAVAFSQISQISAETQTRKCAALLIISAGFGNINERKKHTKRFSLRDDWVTCNFPCTAVCIGHITQRPIYSHKNKTLETISTYHPLSPIKHTKSILWKKRTRLCLVKAFLKQASKKLCVVSTHESTTIGEH